MFPDKEELKTDKDVGSENSPKASTSSDEDSRTPEKPKCSAITMPAFGISPPNFAFFEDIMKTAHDIEKMAIVNEIVLNDDFKLQRNDEPKDPIEKAIKENMRKAFWEILSEELKESPPNYRQVISLLREMKELLLMVILQRQTQIRAEINEILDFDLIQQQVDNEAFEWERYAHAILSFCSRSCAPGRDDLIKNLSQEKELIPMFKGIFDLLEKMNLDISNFLINHFRNEIKQSSAEYEREKFKELVQTHESKLFFSIEFFSFLTGNLFFRTKS